RTTIKDVARAAGVSVSTASMALNDREGVSEATRAKVNRCARELCYIPSHSARSLVMRNSNCIGLMIPEIQNPFYSNIVDILTHIAAERGYTLLLGITNNSSRQEAAYVHMFLSYRVRAVILIPTLSNAPDTRHLELLRAAEVPIVFCTDRYTGCEEALVMCDFETGQYRITKYLIERGLRDLSFVSTRMDAFFSRLRYQGYVRALREAGIPSNPKRELFLEEPRYGDAYRATEKILDDLPQAVVCINDIMTLGIMKRLVEAGLRIPKDISVVGFDDIMFSELVTPPLTTVRQPLQAICEKTMALLEAKTLRKTWKSKDDRIYLVAPELILRGTSI
ncbi:MAG: LacI family DNA-binding transcriptional regulator, partial [Bacillota bacterium]|nr:LacI family DNA-binding transcriptional regulator [Bacillota bacterium]